MRDLSNRKGNKNFLLVFLGGPPSATGPCRYSPTFIEAHFQATVKKEELKRDPLLLTCIAFYTTKSRILQTNYKNQAFFFTTFSLLAQIPVTRYLHNGQVSILKKCIIIPFSF